MKSDCNLLKSVKSFKKHNTVAGDLVSSFGRTAPKFSFSSTITSNNVVFLFLRANKNYASMYDGTVIEKKGSGISLELKMVD